MCIKQCLKQNIQSRSKYENISPLHLCNKKRELPVFAETLLADNQFDNSLAHHHLSFSLFEFNIRVGACKMSVKRPLSLKMFFCSRESRESIIDVGDEGAQGPRKDCFLTSVHFAI